MFLNTVRIRTGTSYKTHLAMALKILETPPEVVGDVIECGTWKGGSAANLSLVCRIVGRRLKIFDSFEGLPAGESGDREAHHYRSGDYCGTLEEVRRNIRRYGAIESCEFLSIIGGDLLDPARRERREPPSLKYVLIVRSGGVSRITIGMIVLVI